MSILVTGCGGFIGSHFTETLIKDGKNVVGFDNFDSFYSKKIKFENMKLFWENPKFKFFDSDYSDFSLMKSSLIKNIDTIVHLAASAGVRPSMDDPIKYINNNILKSVKLLENCRKLDIKNIIFASSSSVYGNSVEYPFNENSKLDKPISNYAASKLSNELFNHVYSSQYGMNITNLRFFTVYGPRQRPEMGIHKFFRKINNDEIITVFGDGKTSRDYTYVSDIIQGINLSLKSVNGYQTFNLGNAEPVKLIDLIKEIELVIGKKANIKYINIQKGDVNHTLADIHKAKKYLKYNPKISLKEGLIRFKKWFSNKNS